MFRYLFCATLKASFFLKILFTLDGEMLKILMPTQSASSWRPEWLAIGLRTWFLLLVLTLLTLQIGWKGSGLFTINEIMKFYTNLFGAGRNCRDHLRGPAYNSVVGASLINCQGVSADCPRQFPLMLERGLRGTIGGISERKTWPTVKRYRIYRVQITRLIKQSQPDLKENGCGLDWTGGVVLWTR